MIAWNNIQLAEVKLMKKNWGQGRDGGSKIASVVRVFAIFSSSHH